MDVPEALADAVKAAEIEVAAIALETQLYLIRGLDVEAITMASKVSPSWQLSFYWTRPTSVTWLSPMGMRTQVMQMQDHPPDQALITAGAQGCTGG